VKTIKTNEKNKNNKTEKGILLIKKGAKRLNKVVMAMILKYRLRNTKTIKRHPQNANTIN
jgi:isopentenyl phosphate kinase